MARRKDSTLGPVQVSLHKQHWKTFQKLCESKLNTNPSKHLRAMIEAENARLSGVENSIAADYEELKQQHHALICNIDKLEKTLEKHQVYDKLVALVKSNNLATENYANLDEVMPKIFKEWTGYQEDAHLFATLLEMLKKKREIEDQLLKIRTIGKG
jgi:hypothetical protein